MLNFNYQGLPEKYIEDKEDFYRSGIQEASKIRNLCTTLQRLFVTNSKNINLFLLGPKDVYRIDVYQGGARKSLVAQVYYLPRELRLDLYDGGDPGTPMLVWKSKKCIHNSLPGSLQVVKAESIFLPLISAL